MTTIRFCSHCQRELTDAVSLSLGVGPVCRGIENEVYAKALPVDDAALTARVPVLFSMLHLLAPETSPVVTEVLTTLLSSDRPADLRATVKRLDWACSYAQPKACRDALIGVIKALGYVGLALIIEGQNSTTPADVTAENGKILVKGSKNSAATHAFKAIQGWSFSHTTKTWSFPAAQGSKVKLAVHAAYPATKTDLDVVIAAATEQAAALAPVVAPIAPVPAVKPAVVQVALSIQDGKLIAKTAAYFPVFIAELKTLPWKDRQWNLPEAPRAWTIALSHKVFVETLIAKHFPAAKAA